MKELRELRNRIYEELDALEKEVGGVRPLFQKLSVRGRSGTPQGLCPEEYKRSTRSPAGGAGVARPGDAPPSWTSIFLFRVKLVELCNAEFSPGELLFQVKEPEVPDIPGLVNLLVRAAVVDAAAAAHLFGRLTYISRLCIAIEVSVPTGLDGSRWAKGRARRQRE